MASASRWNPDESLTLQLPRELALVEDFVDDMEADPSLRAAFVEAPVSTLVNYGIVPTDGESSTTISRGNLIFLSIASNKELIDWISENATLTEPSTEVASLYKQWFEGKGPLDIPPEFQAEMVQDFATNEAFMSELVSKLYEDSAFRSSLPEGVDEPQLQQLLTQTLADLRAEVALGQLPRLEADVRPVAFVVLIPVLAIAIVAIAIAAAVVVVVWAWVWVWGVAFQSLGELQVRSALAQLSDEFAELRGEEPAGEASPEETS